MLYSKVSGVGIDGDPRTIRIRGILDLRELVSWRRVSGACTIAGSLQADVVLREPGFLQDRVFQYRGICV
jgi:hypothetical protein